MQIIFLGLLSFLIYVPLFIGSSLYAAIKREDYLFSKGDISDLGQNVPGLSDDFFRGIVFLFGVLNLTSIFVLRRSLPGEWYAQTALALYFVADLSLISFSFFPENTRSRGHAVVGGTLFPSTILSSFFFIPTILISGVLPIYLVVLNVLIIIFGTLFCWAELMETETFTDRPLYLKEIHMLRGIWEWQTFFLSAAWIFIVTLIIFQTLYF